MKPYQERVVEEKKQLDERANKLDQFVNAGDIFPGLDQQEKLLLLEQLKVMRRYGEILEQRIKHFNG